MLSSEPGTSPWAIDGAGGRTRATILSLRIGRPGKAFHVRKRHGLPAAPPGGAVGRQHACPDRMRDHCPIGAETHECLDDAEHRVVVTGRRIIDRLRLGPRTHGVLGFAASVRMTVQCGWTAHGAYPGTGQHAGDDAGRANARRIRKPCCRHMGGPEPGDLRCGDAAEPTSILPCGASRRRGYGAGAVDDPRLRPAIRRARADLLRARPGHDAVPVPAAPLRRGGGCPCPRRLEQGAPRRAWSDES